MTRNIPTRQERLSVSWANEFFLLHQRDLWYHALIVGLLSAILTLEMMHWFGRF